MLYELKRGRSADELLRALTADRVVFAPVRGPDGQLALVRADGWDSESHTFGAFRPVEPVKALFFPPRERVGLYDTDAPVPDLPERVVIGVKNCDLSALRIHDHVFLHTEPRDPFYEEARNKTLIVSADCTDCLDVCFCPAVDEQPHPEAGFDVNLSPIEGGLIVESGSERGEEALKKVAELLEPAGDKALADRKTDRERMHEKVGAQAREQGLRPGVDLKAAVREKFHSELWAEFARDCVECGACNFICCTCHCFQLTDGGSRGNGGDNARSKTWDSCLFKNFGAEAGGSNPRGLRAARLRNRFDKKFVYFPEVLGTYACDGCGRCVEACAGEIDIREVLKRVIDGSEPVRVDSS